MLLGAVTRWPEVGRDYSYELAQIKFLVRRDSADPKSLRVFSDPEVW